MLEKGNWKEMDLTTSDLARMHRALMAMSGDLTECDQTRNHERQPKLHHDSKERN